MKSRTIAVIFIFAAMVLASAIACTPRDQDNANTTATTTVSPPPTEPSQPELTVTSRPARIEEIAKERGEQEEANPTVRVIEPREGSVVSGSTVNVRLDVKSDKGYKPGKDPGKDTGNHIHVILDNQPYEAYYNMSQPFELRNVTEGRHTLRFFASRPWHESYKNQDSFAMVTFEVKGGGDASKPTTTNTGQVMSDNQPKEGKDMAASKAGDVDPKRPLVTYSRPKGEYKGVEADPIMIDFWLSNARLQGEGGEYRVRYSVDGGEPRYIDRWEPFWLQGWTSGKHTVKLELVDKDGNVVDNGGYNSTTREITVAK